MGRFSNSRYALRLIGQYGSCWNKMTGTSESTVSGSAATKAVSGECGVGGDGEGDRVCQHHFAGDQQRQMSAQQHIALIDRHQDRAYDQRHFAVKAVAGVRPQELG